MFHVKHGLPAEPTRPYILTMADKEPPTLRGGKGLTWWEYVKRSADPREVPEPWEGFFSPMRVFKPGANDRVIVDVGAGRLTMVRREREKAPRSGTRRRKS